MKAFLKKIFRRCGYDVISAKRSDELYFSGVIPYMTQEQKEIVDTCRPFTQSAC